MTPDPLLQAPLSSTPPLVAEFARGSMTVSRHTIFIVDDDYFARSTIRLMLEEAGWLVEDFESCEAFLELYRPRPDTCLVLDVHFSGMGGVELLQHIKEAAFPLPVVVVSGSSGITDAVRSMKAGALDFIEKPIRQAMLVTSVRRALEQSREFSAYQELRDGLLGSLTPRERQVMNFVLAGSPSKNIAVDLGISQRTVENHRASIMRKTGSKSLPALGRLAQSLSL